MKIIQFCINWANEKLQNQFNNHSFNSQVTVLKNDGINVSGFTFENNDKCLNMIEHLKKGIVGLIADECQVPKGSDESLIQKIIKEFTGPSKTKYFEKVKYNL